jgi:hypothetical protein
VYEETAAAPDWGDRLDPEAINAIKTKKLLPVAELDRGFIHPTYPSQVIVSYFQAGRICDFIAEKWGYDKLQEMLRVFAQRKTTTEVIQQELKITPAEFDKQFLPWLEAQTKRTVEGFDEWRKKIKAVSEFAKLKAWDDVIKTGEAIRDLYPDYVEAGSVYEFLSEAWIAKGNKPKAMQGGRACARDAEAAGGDADRGRQEKGSCGDARTAHADLSERRRIAQAAGRFVARTGELEGRDPRISSVDRFGDHRYGGRQLRTGARVQGRGPSRRRA